MWIRSQDRKMIINANNADHIDVYNGKVRIGVQTSDYYIEIGFYPSEKKAIKVLDMIQEAMSPKLIKVINTADEMPTANYNPFIYSYQSNFKFTPAEYVFQMPQDSEVG